MKHARRTIRIILKQQFVLQLTSARSFSKLFIAQFGVLDLLLQPCNLPPKRLLLPTVLVAELDAFESQLLNLDGANALGKPPKTNGLLVRANSQWSSTIMTTGQRTTTRFI